MDAFHLINRIEALIESGNRVPLTHRVVLDEQALFAVIDQLRLSIPEDIRQAQAVLQQRDALLADAHAQAQRILQDAEQKAHEIIEMSDFVQLAKQRADEIMHDTEQQSQQILRAAEQRAIQTRQEADAYCLEALRKLDAQLVALISGVRKGIEALDAPADAASGRHA